MNYYLLFAGINLYIIFMTVSRRDLLSIAIIILLLITTECWVDKDRIGMRSLVKFGLIFGFTIVSITVVAANTQWGGVLIKDIDSKLDATYLYGVQEESASYRLSEPEVIIDKFRKSDDLLRWVIGFGNGAEFMPKQIHKMYASTDYLVHNVHNTYAAIFYRMGLLGLTLFIIFILSSIKIMIWLISNHNLISEGDMDVIKIIMIMFITTVILENNTIFTFIGDMYWGVLLGIIGLLFKRKSENTFMVGNNKLDRALYR
jgi:O-antigen ligase